MDLMHNNVAEIPQTIIMTLKKWVTLVNNRSELRAREDVAHHRRESLRVPLFYSFGNMMSSMTRTSSTGNTNITTKSAAYCISKPFN